MKQKYIIAIDSFKGCLTSAEAAGVAASAIKACRNDAETVCLPVSDGGEGMAEAFTAALGGDIITTTVHDLMMRRTEASYGVTAGGTAVIEAAKACGLTLVRKDERNPMRATTYGVGELVAAAVKRGCRNFIIGLGGSGTSDAGTGMLRALTDILAPRGGNIDDALAAIKGRCSFTLACDVDNPLLGPDGAAAVFGPQKGATPDMLPQLERRAERFSRAAALHCGYDRSACSGAGAAGGLGYAFMQFLDAVMRPGADLLLDLVHFDSLLDGAACVITGEGHADGQTLMGKLPLRVMRRAADKGVPTWLLAGSVTDRRSLIDAGFALAESITPGDMSLDEAMKKDVAKRNLYSAIVRILANNNL